MVAYMVVLVVVLLVLFSPSAALADDEWKIHKEFTTNFDKGKFIDYLHRSAKYSWKEKKTLYKKFGKPKSPFSAKAKENAEKEFQMYQWLAENQYHLKYSSTLICTYINQKRRTKHLLFIKSQQRSRGPSAFALDNVELYEIHPEHPLLLVGQPVESCPESFGAGKTLITKGFSASPLEGWMTYKQWKVEDEKATAKLRAADEVRRKNYAARQLHHDAGELLHSTADFDVRARVAELTRTNQLWCDPPNVSFSVILKVDEQFVVSSQYLSQLLPRKLFENLVMKHCGTREKDRAVRVFVDKHFIIKRGKVVNQVADLPERVQDQALVSFWDEHKVNNIRAYRYADFLWVTEKEMYRHVGSMAAYIKHTGTYSEAQWRDSYPQRLGKHYEPDIGLQLSSPLLIFLITQHYENLEKKKMPMVLGGFYYELSKRCGSKRASSNHVYQSVLTQKGDFNVDPGRNVTQFTWRWSEPIQGFIGSQRLTEWLVSNGVILGRIAVNFIRVETGLVYDPKYGGETRTRIASDVAKIIETEGCNSKLFDQFDRAFVTAYSQLN